MCLIFVRSKQNAPLNRDALKRAYTDNPDGVGLLWWDNVRWREARSIEYTFDDVMMSIAKLEERQYFWAVHFRWATEGDISKQNCHPFPIGDGGYLMHNGVLPYTPTRKNRSDTWQFSRWVKGIGVHRFYQYEELFEQATKGSRMLYALPTGAVRYSGDWVHKPEGLYSNSRCLSSYVSWGYSGRNTLSDARRYDAWMSDRAYTSDSTYRFRDVLDDEDTVIEPANQESDAELAQRLDDEIETLKWWLSADEELLPEEREEYEEELQTLEAQRSTLAHADLDKEV